MTIKSSAFLAFSNSLEGAIIADLFEEERCFDNADMFWTLQNEAIAALKDDYPAKGWWTDVEIMDDRCILL